MYAIVDIRGQQVKVTPNAVLRVPHLDADEGSEVTLDRVLVWAEGDNVEFGRPTVEGKSLTAEVVRHGKDRKVIVFKKKRRKKYRRKNGHRQLFTEIRFKSF